MPSARIEFSPGGHSVRLLVSAPCALSNPSMRSANTFHGAKVQAGGMAKDTIPGRPILKLRPVPAPEPEAKPTTEPEAKPRKGKAKWRTAARYLAGLDLPLFKRM